MRNSLEEIVPTVTGDGIREALARDPDFSDLPQGLMEVIQRYAERLPELLKDLLDQPANPANILDAKFRFLKYCLENHFIRNSVDSLPDDMLGGFARSDLPEMMNSQLQIALEIAENTRTSLTTLMETMMEEDIMAGIGLNEKATALYRSESLTIADLLLIQPAIIVKNT